MDLAYLMQGLKGTLLIWVGSLALAVLLGVVVAAGRRSHSTWVRSIVRVWVAIVRGIPPLVWMLLLFFGLGWGLLGDSPIFAAVVALGLINSAYIGDSINAGLSAVPRGQWEACQAMALPKRVAYLRVILPQAFPIMLASSTAYAISLLKNTAIASIIGANEMVFYAYNTVQLGADALTSFFVIGLVYLAFSVPIGFLARWIEGRSVIAQVR
ncbi:amino acid ABC transporter permease [Cryobacterium sp. PH29-G1]|uniref:amino acid ABC transporter permease n=1 Tax=Cryobacterium sp. PH29-G1 TaxID=3046211 RepID=UPI0024BA0186|nr:amino acid ABC transporter permease [Cryobacterium sp. PH29-G1]MDJ0349615.1 amino acid ABC transporter permease [Cryobacterium sp. PH29-G1]